MWFDSWSDLWRVLLVGAAAYVTVVVVLRSSGKRTLAKLNAFDLVVTVALGSTLATILLSSTVAWAEGAVALVLLASLQFAVAWLATRFPREGSVLTARSTLLLRHGEPCSAALLSQRVSENELRQAVRSSGGGDLSKVAAVVLESDGSLSIIKEESLGDGSTMADVPGFAGPTGI